MKRRTVTVWQVVKISRKSCRKFVGELAKQPLEFPLDLQ